VILQVVTIQIVLLMHTAFAWVRFEERKETWSDIWVWPSFILSYEIFSEVIPYLFFCYILFKQVRHFRKIIKHNTGLAVIQNERQREVTSPSF